MEDMQRSYVWDSNNGEQWQGCNGMVNNRERGQ